jgi:hypothetical protein
MRTALVITAVLCLTLAGAAYLVVFAVDQALRPGIPRQIGTASLIGEVVDPDGELLIIEDLAGRIQELPQPELHLVNYAPRPVILPEPGDLLLTAEVAGETWYLFAGSADGCPHAVKFDYAFEEPNSIIGARYGGLGEDPSGFRLPKASDFSAVDPPDSSGRWYDYYVTFCLNDAGEVVDSKLFSAVGRPIALRQPPVSSFVPQAAQ